MPSIDRRRFLARTGALTLATACGGVELAFAAAPASARERHLLVLIELRGGNDGLNTLVPYADSAYATLRPRLAIPRDSVVQLSDRAGLHPSLTPLRALWEERRLAVLQGVGYPSPNLSHFRSIEIWDTAARSDEYLAEGWLTRAFEASPRPAGFAADGVVVGSNELGPIAGRGSRAIALADTGSFQRRARLAEPSGDGGNRALAHIRKVESDIRDAASKLVGRHEFATAFPQGAFGNAIRTACQIIANPAGVAVVRVTLDGFDTHANQLPIHTRLLGELAQGMAALEAALKEIGRYNDTLVLTYAEFGRRPKENQSGGTDHGTSSVHFAFGGRVQGGLYGAAPELSRLTDGGNPAHALDFRAVYATVLDLWWGIDAQGPLRGRFAPIPFLQS